MKTLKPRIKSIRTRPLPPVVTTRDKSRSARLAVLKRDGYLCQLCLQQGIITQAVVVDHIVPLHVGGPDTATNKWSLCKYHHDLKSAQEQRLRDGL